MTKPEVGWFRGISPRQFNSHQIPILLTINFPLQLVSLILLSYPQIMGIPLLISHSYKLCFCHIAHLYLVESVYFQYFCGKPHRYGAASHDSHEIVMKFPWRFPLSHPPGTGRGFGLCPPSGQRSGRGGFLGHLRGGHPPHPPPVMVIFMGTNHGKTWYNPLSIGGTPFSDNPHILCLCASADFEEDEGHVWKYGMRKKQLIVKYSTMPNDSIVRILAAFLPIQKNHQKIGKEHMPNKPESFWPIAAP